jgi:hypothetical protein
MNRYTRSVVLILAALPFASMAGEEKASCIKDVTFSQEFLKRYPNAPAACQEAVKRDGTTWIRFNSEVTKVKDGQVTMDFKNVAGDALGTLVVAPAQDARLTVGGKEIKYSSLKAGDKLDVWVPDGKFGFYSEPGAAESAQLKVISQSASTEQ